ncbi:MAG: hypothetical protein NT003_04565 [Candidatus Magasanikbacteria bacterium]|nr:hypothetical protein [Candidatus Magasanikbacteria bacterium]
MKSSSLVSVFSGVALVFVAVAALICFVAFQQGAPIPAAVNIFSSNDAISQKQQISNYLSAALAINAQYKSGVLSRDAAKQHALELTVPAILQQRHLEWILNLDAGRDGAIDAMMQEYATLAATP